MKLKTREFCLVALKISAHIHSIHRGNFRGQGN